MKRLLPWLLCLLLMCVGVSALAETSVTPLDNLQLSQNERGELHVDWSASAQEGACYLVFLMDTENIFTTNEFFEGVSSCDFPVVPGRTYQVEAYAGPVDATLEVANMPKFTHKWFFTPEERLYGNYLGNQNCELGWEEVEATFVMQFSYGGDSNPLASELMEKLSDPDWEEGNIITPLPVGSDSTTVSNKLRDNLDPVTVSKLVDPNVALFLNFLTTYPEANVSKMTVALYAPDGQCYDKTVDFSQVAVYQQAEGFSMSVTDLFHSCNQWSNLGKSGLPTGEYVIRYALDGQWAGQTSFEVLAD